jgi:hypothetical protein
MVSLVSSELNTKEQYITAAYTWAHSNFDGTKPIHQLALIASIACAGLLPNIFHPDKMTKPSSPLHYRDFIRDMDWTTRPRKGVTVQSSFMHMVTVFIISLYEPTSTISCRKSNKEWFAKHSKYFPCLMLQIPVFSHCFPV